jgi:peptide/nickel transport system permease protein
VLRYIVRRLLGVIPVLFGLSVILFLFIHALPGDPATAILGQHARPDLVEAMRHRLGLDRPLLEQYALYLGQLSRGDLGNSFVNNRSVLSEFIARFPGTVELTLAALLFAVGVGIPLGRFAGRRPQSLGDAAVTFFSLVGVSIPVFVLGLTLGYIFGVIFGILPATGRIDARIQLQIPSVTGFMLIDTLLAGRPDAFVDAIRHLILPAIALGSIPLAIVARITRASVLDVQNEDYVRTARAKGLRPGVVDRRHVMRNALLPVTTIIGLQMGLLLSGAVLTETVFAWPGVGSWLKDAIFNRDYPVLQSGILFLAVVFVVVNLLVDVSYAYINPRIRLS